eukprot:CAMPEP_0185016506 /NCGR_PEP_ID=MMETSP1098-20130426/100407_1 /TAXON_ID=89044 /ORGANISM="Spumella elongata, Strain CCAP 955/1" /LENGTH=482 /DNA_ID=CAMNT_0027545711 /DNA_START=31 /DNA_END=1479 /DNA_ORIENTATION=+
MNQANQRQLFQQTNQGLLGIRQSEVNYYQSLNVAFGTQAALMGGFTYGVFTQNILNEDNGYANIHILCDSYWICSAITIALAVHVILCTMLMQVLGPGLALNGPVGSMARATEGMKIEQKPIIHAFISMMIMFSASTVLSCWVVMDLYGAVGCSIAFAIAACYWYKYCERIYLRFYWDEDDIQWEPRDSNVGPGDMSPRNTDGPSGNSPNELSFHKKKRAAKKSMFSFFQRTDAKSKRSTQRSVDSDAVESDQQRSVSGDNAAAAAYDARGANVTRPVSSTSAARGVVMDGYLTKRGGSTANYLDFRSEPWERRYFTLTSTAKLFVYKSRQDYKDSPKSPIYTRPLDLNDYYIEVYSTAGDASYDKKSLINATEDETANPIRFQMTLVLRDNVHEVQTHTVIGLGSPAEVFNVLNNYSQKGDSPLGRTASTSSVTAAGAASLASARQQMYRDHWVLRCDTEEELQDWVNVITSLCPSCFLSF